MDRVSGNASGWGSKIKTGLAIGVTALAGLGVAAGAAAVNFIGMASDMEEANNKVGVVFGDSAESIRLFADGAAQNLGLSESAALSAAGTFGNLFVAMGIGQQPAADMSQSILTLASDLASFNNIPVADALEKIRAGLVGETEPLRTLGVNLNAAAIEAKALELGLASNAEALTPAMKAQAAYALILEQTTTAQGDFARTKDGMANSMRVIQASFADIRAEIGARLLPIVTPLIVAFAARLPGAIQLAGRIMDWLVGRLAGPVRTVFVAVRDSVLTFIQALQGNWVDDSRITPLHRAIGTIGTIISGVIPIVRSLIGWLSDHWRDVMTTLSPVMAVITRFIAAVSQHGLAGGIRELPRIFSEVFESIRTTVGAALGAIQRYVVPALQAVGRAAINWFRQNGPAIADALRDVLQIGIDKLREVVPPLLARLRELIDRGVAWLQGEGLANFQAAATSLGTALWSWVQENIGPLLEQLGVALTAARDWLISSGIPMFQDALSQYTGPVLEAVAEVFVALLVWLRDVGLPLLIEGATALGKALYEWVSPIIPPLLEAVGELLLQLGEWVVTVAAPAIAEKLLEWGTRFVAWVAPQIPPLLAELGKLLLELGTWLINVALPEIGAKLLEWGLAFVNWVAPQIGPLLGELGALLASLGTWLIDTALPEIGAKLLQWGEAFVKWVGPQIPPLLAELGKLLYDLGNWVMWTAAPAIAEKLLEWGQKFLGWVAKDVIPFLADKLADILTEIGEWVIDNADDVALKMVDIGAAVLSGIASGIRNGAESIISSAISFVTDQMPGWLKRALGIDSPSKVMIPVGEMVSAGIAVGILNGLSSHIQPAMQAVAQAISPGMTLEDPVPPVFSGSPGLGGGGNGTAPAAGAPYTGGPNPLTGLGNLSSGPKLGSAGGGGGAKVSLTIPKEEMQAQGAAIGQELADVLQQELQSFVRDATREFSRAIEKGLAKSARGVA